MPRPPRRKSLCASAPLRQNHPPRKAPPSQTVIPTKAAPRALILNPPHPPPRGGTSSRGNHAPPAHPPPRTRTTTPPARHPPPRPSSSAPSVILRPARHPPPRPSSSARPTCHPERSEGSVLFRSTGTIHRAPTGMRANAATVTVKESLRLRASASKSFLPHGIRRKDRSPESVTGAECPDARRNSRRIAGVAAAKGRRNNVHAPKSGSSVRHTRQSDTPHPTSSSL